MDPGSYFLQKVTSKYPKTKPFETYRYMIKHYCIMLTSSLFALNTNSLKESYLGSLSLSIILVTILHNNQLTMSSVYNKDGTYEVVCPV